MKLKPRYKHSPAQRAAATRFINNSKPPKVDLAGVRMPEWKPYVQSKEMERAMERVAASWKPFVG